MTSDLGTHKEDAVLSPLTQRTAQSGASTHHHRRGTGHVAQPRLGDLKSKPRAGRQPLARRVRPRRRSCQAALCKRRRTLRHPSGKPPTSCGPTHRPNYTTCPLTSAGGHQSSTAVSSAKPSSPRCSHPKHPEQIRPPDQQLLTRAAQISHIWIVSSPDGTEPKSAPNGGSRAMLAANDHHAARLAFQSASVLIADFALPVEGELVVAGRHMTASSVASLFHVRSCITPCWPPGAGRRDPGRPGCDRGVAGLAGRLGACFGHCGGSPRRRSGSPARTCTSGSRFGGRHGEFTGLGTPSPKCVPGSRPPLFCTLSTPCWSPSRQRRFPVAGHRDSHQPGSPWSLPSCRNCHYTDSRFGSAGLFHTPRW